MVGELVSTRLDMKFDIFLGCLFYLNLQEKCS